MAIAAVLAAGSALFPATAQTPGLAMLDRLEPGAWDLRPRDGGERRRICVANGRDLIQLRHPGSDCSHYVVEDGASEVTVQYTCRGSNYGRTSIRRENAALVQIESQGIAQGRPFQFTAEARRVGTCR
ncbi:hypothetical protein V5F89_02360 [Pelagerythrobacter marensis]|uniref:DUF3617 domain-containing protein n=1 Tax=Pelagerythrobacter marensis TaxID=543877 RepID=A0ABZ2DAC5_9SPHN